MSNLPNFPQRKCFPMFSKHLSLKKKIYLFVIYPIVSSLELDDDIRYRNCGG